MGRGGKKAKRGPGQPRGQAIAATKTVPSLLHAMVDGNEYGSIVSLMPASGNPVPELRRAMAELEALRSRPCLCYVANLVAVGLDRTSIEAADHLPFNEAVSQVPSEASGVDVFLATPGGSAEQVNLFVEALRKRFDEVHFIIPYKAMSAGTLWALSGDEIWMDSRAFLGPIDPQVRGRDGELLPAGSLLRLLAKIQAEGQARLAKGVNPDWTHVQILKHLDLRQLGAAISAGDYVSAVAAEYLEKYKFRRWTVTESRSLNVTDEMRKVRAYEVAGELSSHDRWKAHGHAISRDVATKELKLRILYPESVTGMERAVRRLWALWYYVFDKAPIMKAILSQEYAYFRYQKTPGMP